MNPAERIYHLLLRLYPAKHRQDYGEAMLLHARDLSRDASQVGRWKVAWLFINLVKDGLWNAWMEHWEVSMANNRRIVPASWLVVLLAALPGLLILACVPGLPCASKHAADQSAGRRPFAAGILSFNYGAHSGTHRSTL